MFTCVCVSVCVFAVFSFVCSVCVYVCVLKRLIHACGDNVWSGKRREIGDVQVEVVSDCGWLLCVIAGCVVCQ